MISTELGYFACFVGLPAGFSWAAGPHNQIESKPAIEAEVVDSETKESANRL